jgi:DNA mismatch endonuclease (patch repair protein)
MDCGRPVRVPISANLTVRCSECKQKMIAKQQSKLSNRWTCEICGKKFKSFAGLTTHITNETKKHNISAVEYYVKYFPRYCGKCGKQVFPKKSQVARYMTSKHLFCPEHSHKTKDTSIELTVQQVLDDLHVDYSTSNHKLPGRPDIVFGNTCIFCDGDYWHMNPRFYSSSKKLKTGQTARQVRQKDRLVNRKLKKLGYKVLRFWEYDIRNNLQIIENRLKKTFLAGSTKTTF